MLMSNAIRQIATTKSTVFAFEISGEVSAAEMEAMADTMNAAFDRHDTVDMVLIFRDFEGSAPGAGLDWSSIKSRFRSLSNVGTYAVVGAPGWAEKLIDGIGTLIPVKTRTFAKHDVDAAWAAVDAQPAGT